MTNILQITNLRCEYRDNPLGIEVVQPRLSWQIESERRGTHQIAYRIVAAASESALVNASELVWDSGRIAPDQSIHVVYSGSPLTSRQRIYWQVTVWDDASTQIDSEPAWWEMGLLRREDWAAKWIGTPFWGGPRTTSPAPYLRKEFALNRQINTARLYATAVGLYECYVNGGRIGEDLLTPGWTDYNKRVQYQVYDISGLLEQGANAFGAILGDGWAVGTLAWVGRQRYADRPQFLAQIVITYDDGSIETIATDDTWKTTSGAILESDLLMGESYDARRELPGWDRAGYDSTRWYPVEVFTDTIAALVATNGLTVRRHEELHPVELRKIEDYANPRWIFDLGQNMVGRVSLRVSGPVWL